MEFWDGLDLLTYRNMGQTSTQIPVEALEQKASPVTPPAQSNQQSSEGVSFTNFLSGYKTYIVAVAMVLYAVGGFYGHSMSSSDAITTILQALGLGALRNGIAAVTKS